MAAHPALRPPRRPPCQCRLPCSRLTQQMRRPCSRLCVPPRALGAEGWAALLGSRLPPLSPPRFWRQMGGHLRVVEASSQGVVWGIGYDGTAWVYTGGYGGGCFQGERLHPRLPGLAPSPTTALPAVPSNPSGFPAPCQSHCPGVNAAGSWLTGDLQRCQPLQGTVPGPTMRHESPEPRPRCTFPASQDPERPPPCLSPRFTRGLGTRGGPAAGLLTPRPRS